MKLADEVQQVIDSGVTPIVIETHPVTFFGGGAPVVRTLLMINSLDVGRLTYAQYRFVARRTKQGDHLVQCHITKLLRELPTLLTQYKNAACFTIPVYARLLRDGTLAKMLFDAFALYPDTSPELLCIELSADILYEDIADAKARIEELRGLGVKVAIAEVGDEFCPIMRLSSLQFDYAFLDAYATARLTEEGAEYTVGGFINFLRAMKVKVIAPALEGEELQSVASALGCDGYTAVTFLEGEVVKA